MAEITLLAKAQASPGFEFTYFGAAPVCRTCPYRHACLTLDVGRKYRVQRVRPVEHPCALQETAANVVEVEPVARTLIVDGRGPVVGGSVEIMRYPCHRLDCPNWSACAGPFVPEKQRFRVERLPPEPATCLIGRSLKLADVV